MAKLLITYKKSTIGYSEDQKRTVRSLGLRKLHQTVVHSDNASVRGMLFKVRHLVVVEEVGDDYEIPQREAHLRPRVIKRGEVETTQVAADQAPTIATTPAPVAPTVTLSEAPSAPAQTMVPTQVLDATIVDTDEAALASSSRETQELSGGDAEPTSSNMPERSESDDLELIEGIGPKIAQVLRDNGITTFAGLAASGREELEAILRAQPNLSLSLASLDTWAEQAQLAADGRWDEFKALTDRLKAGRQV
jgi:large subunit ribosomal protein L30